MTQQTTRRGQTQETFYTGKDGLFTSPLEGEDARRADEGKMEGKGTGFAHNPGLTPHPGANALGPLPQGARDTTRGFTLIAQAGREIYAAKPGMTTDFIPPHPAYGHPLPQGRGERPRGFTARSVAPQCRCAGYSGRVGFTLIELLVVVLIIGILTAVALPQYNKVVKKAQGSEVLVALDALDSALTSYYLEHGTYEGAGPDTFNIDIPELKHFRYAVGCSATAFQAGSSLFSKDHIIFSNNGIVSFILSEKQDIYLRVTFDRKHLSVNCTVKGYVDTTSCADYFNCNAGDRVFKKLPYPPYEGWVGGDCTLK